MYGVLAVSVAYTSNASVYMLRAAIYSASDFVTTFVTKSRTLLHVADRNVYGTQLQNDKSCGNCRYVLVEQE